MIGRKCGLLIEGSLAGVCTISNVVYKLCDRARWALQIAYRTTAVNQSCDVSSYDVIVIKLREVACAHKIRLCQNKVVRIILE